MLVNLHRWKEECPFCKFLAVAISRSAISFGRKLRLRPALTGIEVTVAAPSNDDVLDIHDSIEHVKRSLDARDQQLLSLFLQKQENGWTNRDIADRIGISLAYFHLRLAEIRRRLEASINA